MIYILQTIEGYQNHMDNLETQEISFQPTEKKNVDKQSTNPKSQHLDTEIKSE